MCLYLDDNVLKQTTAKKRMKKQQKVLYLTVNQINFIVCEKLMYKFLALWCILRTEFSTFCVHHGCVAVLPFRLCKTSFACRLCNLRTFIFNMWFWCFFSSWRGFSLFFFCSFILYFSILCSLLVRSSFSKQFATFRCSTLVVAIVFGSLSL